MARMAIAPRYQTKITLARARDGTGKKFRATSKPAAGKFRAAEHEEWEFPSRRRQGVGPRDGKHNLRCIFCRCSGGREILREAAPPPRFIRRRTRAVKFFGRKASIQNSFQGKYIKPLALWRALHAAAILLEKLTNYFLFK